MEKIIVVDNKEIGLKANVKSALIYRSAFTEDMLKAQGEIIKAVNMSDGTIDVSKLDTLRIYRLVWTFAKTYDSETIPFDSWLDKFEEFPVLDALVHIMDLVMSNMTSKTDISQKK